MPHITSNVDLHLFANKALVKALSTKPMKRSNVMPVAAFTSMFLGWPVDDVLSIKDLRLKSLTSLSSDAQAFGHSPPWSGFEF